MPSSPSLRPLRRPRAAPLRALLILSAALSSAACTTAPPRLVPVPPLPQAHAPVPAECARAALARYPDRLAILPAGWALYTPDARARELLRLKAEDAIRYLGLRAQALRCALQDPFPAGGTR